MKSLTPAAAAILAISVSPPALAQRHGALVSMQTVARQRPGGGAHGRIRSAELEREHGRLIYSFDIAVPGRPGVEEVQISALTGRLISRRHESPAAERREAHREARERRHR